LGIIGRSRGGTTEPSQLGLFPKPEPNQLAVSETNSQTDEDVYIDPRSTCTTGTEICTRGPLTRTRGHTIGLNTVGSKRAGAT